jgi:hypothetical protein
MTIEQMRDVELTLLALIERVDAMGVELRRALAELDEQFDESAMKEARYD